MLILIILLILANSILGRPTEELVKMLKNVNWKEFASRVWQQLVGFSLKAGRAACRPLVLFYNVMVSESTTTAEKAIISAAIIYVVSPFDLLPRKILGALGIVDDAAVIAFVFKKVQGKVTPEIESVTETTLDSWFGPSAAIC